MSLDYDDATDSLYISLREGVPRAFGRSLDDRRYVDFGPDGEPIGIELLSVSKGINFEGLPEADAIRELLYRRGPVYA